tara:strand:- start:1578 stop:2495 length:918 start_codon:yes stop_codon:yes gene_type:complete
MWPVLLTGTRRREITEELTREFSDAKKVTKDYFSTWLKVRRFLDSLGVVKLDAKKFRDACPSHSRMVHKVENSEVQKIIYKTSKSSTGRLTIASGPNFLVLPRESRGALCAFEEGSSIYSIDFTSLEPRVALWVSSVKSSEEDVYATLMNMCEISERAVAKQATLSALYGAGVSRLSRTLGGISRAKSLVERVSRFFEVPDLEKRLNQQAEEGYIFNAFGRPLHEAKKQPRLRVNHYIQSTSAELANLLFSDLCEKNPDVKPLLVIHDALIVEIPDHAKLKFFDDAKSIYHKGIWFPTKTEDVNI